LIERGLIPLKGNNFVLFLSLTEVCVCACACARARAYLYSSH
jgi:hypothetical protein